MTGSIAHEIKQPLGAMVMNANASLRWLNKSDPNLAEVQRSLEQIVRDGHRMEEVITSIRAMFGKDVGETSRVDICILAGEVLELVGGSWKRTGYCSATICTPGFPR
jgi:signal transduction histidine kinase